AAVISLALTTLAGASASAIDPGPAGPTIVVPDRSVDPVVLTGAQFPSISAGPEIVVRHPEVAGQDPLGNDCPYHDRWDPNDPGEHSCDRHPDMRVAGPRGGVARGAVRGE